MTVTGPHGGKVRELFFDAEGAPVETIAEATFGELEEYNDDGPIMRTYIDFGPADRPIEETFSFDLRLESQDGPKETWDIRHLETQALVEDLAGLRAALGSGLTDAQWRSKLANMLQLPVWSAAPAKLKSEAYAWLVETRPER